MIHPEKRRWDKRKDLSTFIAVLQEQVSHAHVISCYQVAHLLAFDSWTARVPFIALDSLKAEKKLRCN